MQSRAQGSRIPDLASAADALVGRLLDRIVFRSAPAAQPTMDGLAAAWKRVRAKPGRLSTKTISQWIEIKNFTGVCGYGWLVFTLVTNTLLLSLPVTGWAGLLIHTPELLLASLTTGLTLTRLTAHFAATDVVSRRYASNRRIRTTALLLRTPALLTVASVTAPLLYVSFRS